MGRVLHTILLGAVSMLVAANEGGDARFVYYGALPADAAVELAIEGKETTDDMLVVGDESRRIVRTVEPLLQVPKSQVLEARAYEVRGWGRNLSKTWTVVRLSLSEDYRNRIDELYSRYPDYYLMLELNGSLVDLEMLRLDPRVGYPGGSFTSLEAAIDAYRGTGAELSAVQPLAGQVEEQKRFDREYREAVHWLAKCDSERFAELQEEGLEIGPDGTRDTSDEIDCGQRAPRFPPAPVGWPEVCTEWAEEGRLEDGKREGQWSVANPYRQQIRLNRYRNGERVDSVWLRDCGGGSDRSAAERRIQRGLVSRSGEAPGSLRLPDEGAPPNHPSHAP